MDMEDEDRKAEEASPLRRNGSSLGRIHEDRMSPSDDSGAAFLGRWVLSIGSSS